MSTCQFLEAIDDPDVVKTEHRMRCWLQRRFLGYHVVRVTMEPSSNWFGQIQYRTHWYLAR